MIKVHVCIFINSILLFQQGCSANKNGVGTHPKK